MKELGGNGDPSKRPIGERLAALQRLSRQFHGLGEIPDEEITRLGYVRLGPTHLVPREIAAVRAPKGSREATSRENKEKTSPFGRIEIELPATKEQYREVRGEEIETLQRHLNRLHSDTISPQGHPVDPGEAQTTEEITYFYRERIPSQHPIHEFMGAFVSYLDTAYEDGDEKASLMVNIFYRSTAARDLNIRLQEDDDVRDDGFYLDQDLFGESGFGEEIIAPEKAKELWLQLERKRGQLADPTELSFFQSIKIASYSTFVSHWEQQDVHNTFDLTKQVFSNFLASRGMTEVAARLQEGQTAAEMREILSETAGSNEVLNSIKMREREIKNRLGSVDEQTRRKLTAELSQVKRNRKKVRQLLEGMVSYFDTPALFTGHVKRSITDAQKLLVIPNREGDQLEMILDASPDPIRDADPGRISGDCTAGRPLPFADPNVPVFNVKVSVGGDYIGNIYLLETQTTQGEPVWHLDAIQIPNRAVDWSNTIHPLIGALAAQAEINQVSKITINDYGPIISNYEYIAAAIEGYHSSINGGPATIIVPQKFNHEKYSTFQGNPHVWVLWSQEKKQ